MHNPKNISGRIKLYKTQIVAVNKQKNHIEPNIDYTNEYLSNKFFNMLSLDIGTFLATSIMSPYYRQNKEARKIYVLNKDFYNSFLEVNFDLIQYRHLIRNAMGFVKLPYPIADSDGDEFTGFFFFSGSKHEIENPNFRAIMDKPYPLSDDVVGFAYLKEDFTVPAFHWSPFPVDGTIRIEEGILNVRSISVTGNSRGLNLDGKDLEEVIKQNPDVYKETVTNNYPKHLKLMYNLMVYLNTGKPDLREFRNPFKYLSPTSKKLTRESKELSRSDIVEVGFGYMKEKLQHAESWASKPHLGWRWCGPGRSQLELVPISGSIKSWKEKEQE